jgi:DNA-binding transcriptional LysR family regulator
VNITSVNLNLFVAFDALLAEGSVTRAARRVGVTQSALSNALRQLRALFGDPLFLRGAHGGTPTPRALELAGPVQQGQAALGTALAPRSFEPATAQRRFVLAASDYVEYVLLPPLLRRLAREAPGVHIDVLPWGKHEVPGSLALGDADLMIGFYGRVPLQHHEELLFEEDYVCIARRGHPRIGARLTQRAWTETPHVVVSERPGSRGGVDRALAAHGLTRTVAVRVSHFLIVPHVVAQTDFVAALSRRILLPTPPDPRRRSLVRGLGVFAPPVPLPRARIGQVWHDRLHHDPGHRWLRGVLRAVGAEV